MKAMLVTRYGSPDVLQIQDVAKPEPKDNEVRVRVYATTVGFGDLMARDFQHVSPRQFNMPFFFWLMARMTFGFSQPKTRVLGAEFAGEVDAVGKDVTRFQPGDPVFGYTGPSFGANTEYLCITEDGMIASKPGNLSYEEAATIPYGALTALNLLRKVGVERGQHVLIVGASGGIGSAAVQLAKHFGANVTGVAGTLRLDFVKALGADKVIDYTREDFTQSGDKYDLILDVLGRGSFARSRRVLSRKGRYLYASFKLKQLVQMLWTAMIGGKKVICALSTEQRDDLELIRQLAESGQIKALIDRCYPLEQLADAHRYMESGQRRGRVVVTVAPHAT